MEKMNNEEPTNEELIEIAKKLKNKKAKEYFENQKNAAN